MTGLPPSKMHQRNDLFEMMVTRPLEALQKSLHYGDGWKPGELEPVVNRCRAIVAAYDARVEAAKEDQDK